MIFSGLDYDVTGAVGGDITVLLVCSICCSSPFSSLNGFLFLLNILCDIIQGIFLLLGEISHIEIVLSYHRMRTWFIDTEKNFWLEKLLKVGNKDFEPSKKRWSSRVYFYFELMY